MKQGENENPKRRRQTSIITVFLWLTFIVVMSIIVVNGINDDNAITYAEDRTITLNIDVSEFLQDERYDNKTDHLKNLLVTGPQYMSGITAWIGQSKEFTSNEQNYSINYIGLNGTIATYEINIEEYQNRGGSSGSSDWNWNWKEPYIGPLYLEFSVFSSKIFDRYAILENGNELELFCEEGHSYDALSSVFYVKKIEENQDIYELKLKRREAVTVKMDISEADYMDPSEYHSTEDLFMNIYTVQDNIKTSRGHLIGKEGNVLAYEIYPISNKDYDIAITNVEADILEGEELLDIRRIGENSYYIKSVKLEESEQEYSFKAQRVSPALFSNVKWLDEEGTKVEVEFGMQYPLSLYSLRYNYYWHDLSNVSLLSMIYVEKISDDFILSSEYENDSEWIIATEEELIKNQVDKLPYKYIYEGNVERLYDNYEDISGYIPEYVFTQFIKPYYYRNYDKDYDIITGYDSKFLWYQWYYPNTEKRYIYVKDQNILYYFDIVDINETEKINFVYVGDDKSTEPTFSFETDVIFFDPGNGSGNTILDYLISSLDEKKLKLAIESDISVKVNKFVEGEKGNNTYYIGLFENDTDIKTDNIYPLNTVDGSGEINIEVERYDNSKTYYIYEVDENGEKIENKKLIYSKNQVLNSENIIYRNTITSNKNIISSVLTEKYDEPGVGAGEESYINNEILSRIENKDVVTIRNLDEKMNLEVIKIWDDNDDKAGKRPESVTLQIKRNGIIVAEEVVSSENEWKHTFELARYDELGNEIEYTVDEDFVSEFYIKNTVGNVITNKFVVPEDRINIIGEKIWDDNENQAGKRDDSVILQVYVGEEIVAEGEVSEKTNWKYEFELAKYDENGNEIEYKVDEKEITNKFYKKIEIENEDMLIQKVENKFIVPDEVILVKAIKKWEDNNDEYEKRPESVTLQVFAGDNVVAEETVNKTNNWSYEFKLPKYNDLGDEIEYTVDEKNTPDNYKKKVEGYTVINISTYKPPVDTGDKNIWIYLVVFLVAIIGVVVGSIFIRNSNKNKIK
ncbi:MAG: Cna B-type domain-containing protein [Clostridia bacterium]|nr:Cna B-type domain-containing protein [Clostridia bacterium]